MAVTAVILMCLFCGALGQNDETVMTMEEVLSMLSVDQGVTVNDLLPQSVLDDAAGIVVGDDTDDVINLELAQSELVGGCSHGECKFCAKKFKFNFCIDAKLIQLGFDLKVTLNGHVLYHKEVSVANPPPICVQAPFVGKVCIRIYDVDLKQKKACVGVLFKVKVGPIHKTIKLKIACFQFGKHADAPLIFTQLLNKLVEKELNSAQ